MSAVEVKAINLRESNGCLWSRKWRIWRFQFKQDVMPGV